MKPPLSKRHWMILKIMKRFDEAISKYTEAVDILKTLHKGPHTDTADALYYLAYCYYRTDEDVKAWVESLKF